MSDKDLQIHTPDPEITRRFIELYEQNRKRILGFILTLVPSWSHAEDIMQETSELMWTQFADTEPIANFAAWGISIARFKILEYRRRNCQQFIQFNDEILMQIAEEALKNEKDVPDYIEALRKCRKKLDKQSQALLELRYEKGVPVKHIGEHVGRTLKSLYRDLARIHAQLHSCVKRTLAESDKCLVTDTYDWAVDLPGALGESASGDSSSAALEYEICLLSLEVLDGVITEERFARLEFLLAVSPQRLQFYVEFMLMCAGLQSFLEPTFLNKPPLNCKVSAFLSQIPSAEDSSVFLEVVEKDLHDTAIRQTLEDAQAQLDAQEEALRREHRSIKPRFGRREVYRGLLRIAAMMIVAAGIILLDRQIYRRGEPEVLARLTGVDNSQWAGLTPLALGNDLTAGPLELQKGLAELTFANGAKIVMEAPARIHLQKSDEVYLEEGKIAVTASGSAIGFAVNTENARIVDLGTEFGVASTTGGATDVQVYQGEVALMPDWKKNSFQANATSRMNLTKGQAHRVNADHSVVVIPHNDVAFVRLEEFAVRQQARQGNAYARWQAWSYQVRRDPDLVVYYPFERHAQEPQTLFNYAASTFGRMNGQLTTGEAFGATPAWVEGRWPGKSALQFDRARGSRVVTPADKDFCLRGDITIAIWLRCPETRYGGHLLANRQQFNVNYQVAWGEYADKAKDHFTFARYISDTSSDKAHTQSPLELSKEWHFLAVTYDNNVVCYYIDGALYETVPYVFTPQQPALADLIIGDVPDGVTGDQAHARFNGLMDEIAIFRRVLMPEEIQTMYNAGKTE